MTRIPGQRAHKAPTRRTFLGAACGVVAAGGVGAVRQASALDSPRTRAPWPLGPNWQIEAVRVEETFNDGSTVPFFRFVSHGDTPTNGTLPLLRATEGSYATLTVTNSLSFPIQPQIVGGDAGRIVEPGAKVEMALKVPRAGTWLLTDALLGVAAGPVGLGAVIVSERPFWRNRRRFDREYVLLYQDADDRWNADLDAGSEPDTAIYEPNFHTINGLTFPTVASDPDSRIVCRVGETVLIRLANLGRVRHAIHFHGYHVDVLAQNNVPEYALPPKDTIPVPAYSTVELALLVTQPGVYPVHPHSLTTVTDNGLYAHGQITLIEAT